MSTNEALTQSLMNALITLPNTADGIAAEFIRTGVTGKAGNAGSCPLANFISMATGYVALVGPPYVWIRAEFGSGPYMASEDLDLSAPLTEFVRRFDDGDWPELQE